MKAHTDYRKRLFETYHETHARHVDSDDAAKQAWFVDYARRNYLPFLQIGAPTLGKVLDIGCNKGYLLAALREIGFTDLHGIDLSPQDIEIAQRIAPQAHLACTDAFQYLEQHPNHFDVIIIKAVLEHINKQNVLPLVEKMHEALKSNGVLLIDVPNMDWLFAGHERYMDFTHEVGFTKESLRQVLRNVFTDVVVAPVEHNDAESWRTSMKRRFARALLTKLLLWADPQGASNPIWARSIIGVGRK